MQFILAALVYSSSAESNRVLSDIPFGPAKSHIRRLRIANRLWINVSIPNVNYATDDKTWGSEVNATDDEIWGSEFPIDTEPTNLATEQGSTVTTVKGFRKYSKPEETNTYSLCDTQRNLIEKDVTTGDNCMLPATHADEHGDEANKQFGDTEGHENRGSTTLQITGNEIVLEARGSYSPHTLNTTTLQQGELSILIIDECGPQLPVTDFRYLHELHEFTSAASHIGLTFLHGTCLRNTFNYDRHERTVNAMQLELDERDQKLNDQQREPDELRALQKKVITRTTRTIRGECREACQSCMPT